MIREAIEAVVSGRALSMAEASSAMEEIMAGQATPAQIAAFITALRMKGETADEIAGMAQVMRQKALRVQVDGDLVDTCGTGGDRSGTFNISTAAAFVAAGAGIRVAKHGNRAMSGSCGSADVLEASGVKIDLGPAGVERCIQEAGFGFMFAQVFHPSMKHAAGPRREVGIRTVFNILGPLTNPAGAQAQVLGVAEAFLGEKLAHVLARLGSRHALVVHGEDGLDELTTTAATRVWELQGGVVRTYTVVPEGVGLARASLADLKGGSPQDNARLLRQVLGGERGPLRDVVLFNAAAALVAGDRAPGLREGAAMAAQAVDSGVALASLEKLVQVSQREGRAEQRPGS
ncbi:MAG: anthranilate phosphoribosyltransferase [Chloroflexi bacterium]|nr:anthranilate phosphoribosyltransferase [Chloroflexota bacterium]